MRRNRLAMAIAEEVATLERPRFLRIVDNGGIKCGYFCASGLKTMNKLFEFAAKVQTRNHFLTCITPFVITYAIQMLKVQFLWLK